jgi:anaerobic selenocysteine-containing dehydrogenase
LALDDVARAGVAMPRLDGAGTARHPLGRSVVAALPEALASGQPYTLDTLLLHHANPAHAYMAPARWREALARVPYIVSFSPFMDETTALADLVLPDHTYLERWDDAAAAPSVGYPVWGVRQPVVEPLHDTRASGDVVLQLAHRLGGSLEAGLPWKSVEDLVGEDVKSLHAAGRGSIVEDGPKAFRKKLLQEGYWSDGPYAFERWDEVLRTPSGKFEMFAQSAWRTLHDVAARERTTVDGIVAALGLEGEAWRAVMPLHVPPRLDGDPSAFPFVLEPYSPGTYAEGSGANLPLLQELVTTSGQVPWQTVVEIGEEVARRLAVASGDRVEGTSPRGSLTAPVSVRRGIRADVVRIARGGGHTEFGRWARGWGANVMELLAPATDALTGVPAWHATRVNLRKVTP